VAISGGVLGVENADEVQPWIHSVARGAIVLG
jgi:hypothetical protein